MRVAALTHFARPYRNAGSETYLHVLMDSLAERGHQTAIFHTGPYPEYRGQIIPRALYGLTETAHNPNPVSAGLAMRSWRPNIVITQHAHAMFANQVAKVTGCPAVLILHNAEDPVGVITPLKMGSWDLVVANSQWVADAAAPDAFVLHPPINPGRHRVDHTGDACTLVNLNADKGVDLFYRLAQALPGKRFIGVKGAHGKQIINYGLPNVEIWDHTDDLRPVWEQTRVLLMPSKYESFGMVSVEAAVNGIPTIAHPTTGLLEALGPYGRFADRDNVAGWVEEILLLDDHDTYGTAASGAAVLAKDHLHRQSAQLTALGQRIESLT